MTARKDLVCFLNGRFVRLSEAHLSPLDAGFLYGDGVYDTLRVYEGRPFRLTDHLARLRDNLRRLDLPLRGLPDLVSVVTRLIRLNRAPNAVVRVQITRGIQIAPPPAPRFGRPTVFVYLRRFGGYPPAFYQSGVRVRIENLASAPAPRPKAKTTNFQVNILARLHAVRRGCFESVFSSTGLLLEGSMSNVFLVRGRRIATPPLRGILEGITRSVVIRLARRHGYVAVERECPVAELRTADEVFLTSTTIEVMPVREVAGPGWRRRYASHTAATDLRAAYRTLTRPSVTLPACPVRHGGRTGRSRKREREG
ncbi:MAG: aminotransferase class IV [Nitrospirae bacterium]|nr:aminotransferase class IV [Nitrospirota bacterium]